MLLLSLATLAHDLTIRMHPLARSLNPRRSLAAAIGWGLVALSTSLVLVDSVWVDDIVHTNLLDMRGRELATAADNIADELNLGLARRLQSVRVLAAILSTELRDENKAALKRFLENLQHASPEFEQIAVADTHGRILAATAAGTESVSAADRSAFALALQSATAGEVRVILKPQHASPGVPDGAPESAVDLIASVVDAGGRAAGVIEIRMTRRWMLDLASGLKDRLRDEIGTQALVLDGDDAVLVGPPDLVGKRLEATSVSAGAPPPVVGINAPMASVAGHSRVERLADGSPFLVAQVIPEASDPLHALGWSVIVRQPLLDATQGARILRRQITAVLLALGLLAAFLGVLLVRRLTKNLDAIAHSADAIRLGHAEEIVVPPGRNEATRLGQALHGLLASLQRERTALQTLNTELDQRVAARTREIERLAAHDRAAAVVRERLKIARDLHDTLAHSMMAMLAEIRLLKRLWATNPAAVAEELAHAEEAAHQGLKEARAAIAQMRFSPVRDAGLAAALGDHVKLFVERTGIPVDYTSDAPAGAFADEHAEALFRIAEEAMRNVERHARSTRVAVSLRVSSDGYGLTLVIADDGVGFDAKAAHPGHYGLAGLAEQAQLIGALLTIQGVPHHGTTVRVVLGSKAHA